MKKRLDVSCAIQHLEAIYRNRTRNRSLISRLLKRYLKAKRTRAPAYSRALRRIKGVSKRVVKRSSGPISREPEGNGVAVKVHGVVQTGRVND